MAVDQMHDLKAVFSMLVSVLVGNNSDSGSYGQWQGSDFKHQAESELDGVFPEIWLDSEDPLETQHRNAVSKYSMMVDEAISESVHSSHTLFADVSESILENLKIGCPAPAPGFSHLYRQVGGTGIIMAASP